MSVQGYCRRCRRPLWADENHSQAACLSVLKKRRRQKVTPSKRLRILERDGYRCRHCGGVSRLEIDHVVPVHHGGLSSDDNLQVLCWSCNNRKGARVGAYPQP